MPLVYVRTQRLGVRTPYAPHALVVLYARIHSRGRQQTLALAGQVDEYTIRVCWGHPAE
jgi:hypothetical protein